jgi:hypothetical protein
MTAKDVFTPFSFPTVTFIDEHLVHRATILKDALEIGNCVIAISGPSKSRKTVFVENLVSHDSMIHVTGSGVDRAGKLWDRVFDQIGTSIDTKRTEETGFLGSVGAKVGADAGILIRAQGELRGSAAWTSKGGTTEAKATDYQQLLVRELGGSGFVVFIDDFHYITKDPHVELAQYIVRKRRLGRIKSAAIWYVCLTDSNPMWAPLFGRTSTACISTQPARQKTKRHDVFSEKPRPWPNTAVKQEAKRAKKAKNTSEKK